MVLMGLGVARGVPGQRRERSWRLRVGRGLDSGRVLDVLLLLFELSELSSAAGYYEEVGHAQR